MGYINIRPSIVEAVRCDLLPVQKRMEVLGKWQTLLNIDSSIVLPSLAQLLGIPSHPQLHGNFNLDHWQCPMCIPMDLKNRSFWNTYKSRFHNLQFVDIKCLEALVPVSFFKCFLCVIYTQYSSWFTPVYHLTTFWHLTAKISCHDCFHRRNFAFFDVSTQTMRLYSGCMYIGFQSSHKRMVKAKALSILPWLAKKCCLFTIHIFDARWVAGEIMRMKPASA